MMNGNHHSNHNNHHPTTTNNNNNPSDYYYDSYGHFGIHEEMLKDQVRTSSYMKAITRNPHLFKNKIVLDVGCGTGILSMFCAKAGAKLVIGVEYSSIAKQAQQIVEDNGFKEQVHIVRDKIENVNLTQLFGIEKVDIIVSEWMGYCLLYEAMLDFVLVARDRWLKPDGLMFPDVANIYAVAIEDADYKEQKIGFWNDVYGFDFSAIRPLAIREPLVDVVDAKQVMTRYPARIYHIDLNTVKKEQLDFTTSFMLEAGRDDYVHGLVLYFDVVFTKSHKQYGFSTAPEEPYTHWKQTTLYLQEPLTVVNGEKINFTLSCSHNGVNPRELDLNLSYEFHGRFQNITRNGDQYTLR
jgi:protein arginine N-methyltransferase 1